MTKFFLLLAATILLSASAISPVLAASPDPSGIWLDQGGEAAIRVSHCGEAICGSLYWMKDPNDDSGRPSRDTANPNPARRSQPLCGLEILQNFQPEKPGRWHDGTVYDPESGHTFDAELKLKSASVLQLRGYILLPLLGGNERFTKIATPPPACKVP